MAHLGDDIAAYVDGQLPAPAMARADAHLAECERCQEAARQQRALKDRMRGGNLALPPGLVQALGALPTAPPRRTRSLQAAVGATMVVVGAALAVVAVAYSVAPSRHIGDLVAPRPERLASISDAFNRPGRHLGDRALDELHRAGWPSQRRLGYDHYRLDGRAVEGLSAFLTLSLTAEAAYPAALAEKPGLLFEDHLEPMLRAHEGRTRAAS
jgi:hypothetical protein